MLSTQISKVIASIKIIIHFFPQGDQVSLDSKTSTTKLSRRDQLRQDLDDLIARECPFCGDIMVRMVDRLLVEEDQFEDALAQWL